METAHMKAILFDLDGTLLDIDINRFIHRYFDKLSGVIAEIAGDGDDHDRIAGAFHTATAAMMRPHPGTTNQEIFEEIFNQEAGVKMRELLPVFERFYLEIFPSLADGSGPSIGAHEAMVEASRHGLRIAVATNPVFPLAAVVERMRWAEISPGSAHVITSYENMYACKPYPEYFLQTAQMLDVQPADCLMVGDDPVLDLAAADVGMSTFFVGDSAGAIADYRGTLTDLARLIRQVCG